ncbi:MAG TPA: phosphoadenosine phosphosulfate reductase family protein [Reyranella sp.]|nr:phosphoadenosine phosphosulfate reductase family protein [Reyranella sp.]
MARPLPDFSRLDGHTRVALWFSGGKDSLALVHLFRPYWHRLTVVHLDAGDLLPEMCELVAKIEKEVPHFARITTDARAWLRAQNCLPSPLVPIARFPTMRHADDTGPFIVPAVDCCNANRWQPMGNYLRAQGFTLAIDAQRWTDPVPAVFWRSFSGDGCERWPAIKDWSDADVFGYLEEVGAPLLPFYRHKPHAPECATCPAGWNEGRAAYLKQHHPDLAARYANHLAAHAQAMGPALRSFLDETATLGVRL